METIKIAWISEGISGQSGVGKPVWLRFDIKTPDEKFYSVFVNKKPELEAKVRSLRKNMVIKCEVVESPKSGNPLITEIKEVYQTDPSSHASPAQTPPSGEGSIGRLKPSEPDLVAPMPIPMTDAEFNGMIDESIIKASEFLGILESEAVNSPLALYILKGKLQIQHQRFQVAEMKRKELMWKK